MSRTPLHALLLVALLWLAQLQGLMHGISHLGGSPGMRDLGGLHSQLCSDCAAFAQAGAAPTPAEPAVVLLPAPKALSLPVARAAIEAVSSTVYQSRAPPSLHA